MALAPGGHDSAQHTHLPDHGRGECGMGVYVLYSLSTRPGNFRGPESPVLF